MTPIYTRLAEWYDEIFPASPAEMAFVQTHLAGRRRLLDIGSGTGNKTILLADGRESVTAIDADNGMVAAARERHNSPVIQYQVLDMTAIPETFSPDSFDSAVCLGNTLAHLAGADGLTRFLRGLGTVLQPGSVFIGQILNYDRILDTEIHDLPDIETATLRFTRKYTWKNSDMHFETRLENKATGETADGDVVLTPFRPCEVEAALDAAGFTMTGRYGGYDGSELTAGAYHLVFTSVSG